MEFVLSIKDLIYLSAILLGFVTSIILILFSLRQRRTNLLLGFSFLTLSYAIALAFLINSGYHALLPSLYRTGNIAALSFMPLFYLYIFKETKNEGFRLIDLIHFLPLIIYLIDFFPILFFTSLEEKNHLIQSEIDNPAVFVYFNQSRFFPPNFYTLGRTFLIMVYWIFSLRLLHNEQKLVSLGKSHLSKEWVIWVKTYVYGVTILFLPFFALYNISNSQLSYDLIHFTGALFILGNSIIILFFPKILYGIQEEKTSEKIKENGNLEPLSGSKVKEIEEKMKEVMEVSKKFLEQGYNINDMARDVGIPAYLLTQYINRNLGVSFSELINRKRIEECCDKISRGDHKLMTLEGLAMECGFNNRNSFITSFKRYKDATPSQYLKSLEKSFEEK